jgi:hypothetical protein
VDAVELALHEIHDSRAWVDYATAHIHPDAGIIWRGSTLRGFANSRGRSEVSDDHLLLRVVRKASSRLQMPELSRRRRDFQRLPEGPDPHVVAGLGEEIDILWPQVEREYLRARKSRRSGGHLGADLRFERGVIGRRAGGSVHSCSLDG